MKNKVSLDLIIEFTKEEAVQSFKKNNLAKDIMNNSQKEDISGEVLNKLKDEDYNSLKSKKKIKNYLKQNNNSFCQKSNQNNIGDFPCNEEIKQFLEKYLNFKVVKNDSNQFFNLTNDDDIKKLGLNILKRINLINDIGKQNNNNIFIDETINKEEATSYLIVELKLSDNSINVLELNGEKALNSFVIKEIEKTEDFQMLTQEEKSKLIYLVAKIKEGNKNKKINKNEEISKKIEDDLIISNLIKDNKIRNENRKENRNEIKKIIENKLLKSKNSKKFEEEKNENENEKPNNYFKKFFDNKQKKEIDKKRNNSYDLGDKKLARIENEYEIINSEFNKNCHVIIIINKNEIENLKLKLPFLNRFENHLTNDKMVLEEKNIKIVDKFDDCFDLISPFNKNQKLKIDYYKINIDFLRFKIKKNKKIIGAPGYEMNLINTFCQDIIAFLVSSNLNIDKNYLQMNDKIDIYKTSRFYNFKSFINGSKKEIINTFSKITENLFRDRKNIKYSKNGIFDKQSIIEITESIKLENELINIVNTFFGSRKELLNILKSNKIRILNGFNLPKYKNYFDKIINYTKNEIYDKYIQNERELRKQINDKKIKDNCNKYYEELNQLLNNIKNEIKKEEFLDTIYNSKNNEIAKLLLEDYFRYYIMKYLQKKDYVNRKLLTFLILIVKIMLNKDNHHYDFKYDIDEFSKIIIITQGYIEDIKIFLNKFIDLQIYSEDGLNIENQMSAILDENNIKYEISNRNKEYTKIVNLNIFNIIESFIRSILLFSIKLNKTNIDKFNDYINSFPSLKTNLEQLNKKYLLFSKELYNLEIIIKIKEYNINQLTNNYEQIMNIILEQSIYLYNNQFDNFIQSTLNLLDLYDKSCNKEFFNMLFFIFKFISDIDFNSKIKLINIFLEKYPQLIKKSQLFISETLKEIKPEILNEEKTNSEILIDNFMNLDNKNKVLNYKNIYINYNNNDKNPKEFNELLLYILEVQCQSYFNLILKKYNHQYTEKCCEEILLELSFSYFKKAIQYLFDHINNNDNNLLKLYAIAYIKTYSYYLVEVNYEHFEKCNFDEINNLLNNENEKSNSIINMIIIYILRLFLKKCKYYDKFQNFNFAERKFSIFNKIIKDKQDKNIYIFKESFIPKNNLDSYNKISIEIDKLINSKKINESIFNEINQNFDCFYCILVNKHLSFLYGNEIDKHKYIDNLKLIYGLTNEKINLEEEGKKLYNLLMNYDLLEKKIFEKISQQKLQQEEFEILLYSFRFLLNIQMNKKKCFYNELLKKNIKHFIEENYIPGSFPLTNEFIRSYHSLVEEFKQINSLGYYICKDCGFLYQVENCTCPTQEAKCLNGHVIGGKEEKCSKMDIRVFPDKEKLDKGKKNDSFISKTLEDYKKEFVDQYLGQITKGITKGYIIAEFERNDTVRNLHNITYRLLNFILYSNIFGAFILDYLTNEEIKMFLLEDLSPHTVFNIIKKDWNYLNNSLKEIGIENVKIFINIILDKIIELMINLESVDTKEKLNLFEKSVNDYILKIISNKEDINKLNEEYHKINDKMLSLNPQSFKEIIQANYEPSIYSQSDYPNIQFYTISNIYNLDTFKQKFNSSSENKEKYALTNIIINKRDILNNTIMIKNLKNINKLCNLLSFIYSYKISREDAQNKTLKNEIKNILNYYNEINDDKIKDENEFIKEYIEPFIESWNNIKYQSVQYKCQVLCDFEKGEKPLEMEIEKPLKYFLVNEGDKNGGLFLAAAYEYLVKCQNNFIDNILLHSQTNGVLKSYKAQLEQEINIQDASDEEITNINDKTYEKLEELIKESSMRNIYSENDDEINYRNYNDIIYDYDYIEDNLASEILLRIKKFKSKIKFVTFLYEGFRGDNSSILIDYMNKYIQRDLTNEEKKSLDEFLEENNNSVFYNDIFSSLQILMKEIINDNYSQNEIIYDIIEKISKYIKLNQKLIQFLKKHKELGNKNSFTANTLVPIFEYFEKLCWEDIKKNVLPDYKLEINEEIKNHILNYFNINEDTKVIDKKNFATALRKLISRYLSGLRQDTDIDSNRNLMLYIFKEDLWDKDIINSEEFEKEIKEILSIEIKIGQCFNLYNLIGEYDF